MKLAGIVVLYQPNICNLLRNILSYIDDVDQLLVFKNSEVDILAFEQVKPYINKIQVFGTGKNVGIAIGLNAGVKWVCDNNYSHLLTLDQDSFFVEGHLRKFKKLIVGTNLSNIGVFGPNLDNRGHMCFESPLSVIEVSDTITSGSIFPVDIFRKAGGFEEALFIDAVDYEFCYRIKSLYGLNTVIFPEVILIHEVGYPKKIRFGFMTDDYSAMRTYFIIRNHTIIWRRYPNLFQPGYKITLIKTHIIFRIAKVLIGESNKMLKLKAILIGAIHGITGKMGFFKI